MILFYSLYVLSDTAASQNQPEKKCFIEKNTTVKILVHIRNHILDISLDSLHIYISDRANCLDGREKKKK